MSKKKISKAIFPVGGLGTRFLPATKAIPKEMLPIVDKPLIQYAVEEAVEAGIDTLIFITGRNKYAIANHFDRTHEIEQQLQERGNTEQLERIKKMLPEHVSCAYIRQNAPLGLGHAVLCAKQAIGDEPFAVLLADDLLDSGTPGCLAQMVNLHQQTGNCVIAVEEVEPHKTDQYGIVEIDHQSKMASSPIIRSIIEKPAPDQAPSRLGVVGRYILTPQIFTLLEQTAADAGGDIQLTDAIGQLLSQQTIYAHNFGGKRYDCGSYEGFVDATINFALKRPDLTEVIEENVLEIHRKIMAARKERVERWIKQLRQ
ncbi:MAG: UTP--glucose-1-phosphate uridylyltransferase GalU [Chromatiales bacterium]|nr:UTP--glucose-1-phosphate uridylyltransferase GalU [Chromatiales bacterium]